MILIYSECQKNALAATRIYSERFPRDRFQTHGTKTNDVRRLK